MAQAKTELFTSEDITIADIAKALAHPARIKILKILMNTNACMCGEIVDLLPLAQSTVSQHLKELKRVGIIQGEIDGPKICYCLDNEKILEFKILFNNLFQKICQC